jgi:regulatory protein
MSRSASTPSEDPWGEAAAGPPPAWLGDVTDGVDAWTRRASDARAEPPAAEAAVVAEPRGRGRKRAPAERKAPTEPAEQEELGRKILLDQLTGQARSRKELADRLAKREVPEEVATRLLDRFEEVGLVDDPAFARAWVASRQPGKGLARRALAQELRRKGIEDEVAREVLDEIDPDDEREAGRALVRKKLRSMARLDEQTKARRLVGMLARKGYPPGTAFEIVRQELSAGLDGGVEADLGDDTLPSMGDDLRRDD